MVCEFEEEEGWEPGSRLGERVSRMEVGERWTDCAVEGSTGGEDVGSERDLRWVVEEAVAVGGDVEFAQGGHPLGFDLRRVVG